MQQYFAPQNQPPSNQTISASIPSVETSYSTELTDLERDLLEESSLNQWYSAFIGQAGTPDQRFQLVLRVMPYEAVLQ